MVRRSLGRIYNSKFEWNHPAIRSLLLAKGHRYGFKSPSDGAHEVNN